MNQMIPEAMPVRVDVEPVLEVRVSGPGGLSATLRLPDADEAYDALSAFVACLPEALEQGIREAEAQGAKELEGQHG